MSQQDLKEVLSKLEISFVEKDAEQLLSILKFEKVIVSPKKRSWELYINSTDFFSYERVKKLEKSFKEKFPEIAGLHFHIRFFRFSNDFIHNPSFFKDHLLDRLNYLIPSCKPWLDEAVWMIKDDILYITLANQSAVNFLSNRKCDDVIQNLIDEMFDLHLHVKFHCHEKNANDYSTYIEEKEKEENEILRKALLFDSNTKSTASKEESNKYKKSKHTANGNGSDIIYGKAIQDSVVPIHTLRDDSGKVSFLGDVINLESRELKGGKILHSFDVTDYTSSVTCKIFADKETSSIIINNVLLGSYLKIRGECQYDKYQKEITVLVTDINKLYKVERMDVAENKRIELHLHTQLSSMDAVLPIKQAVKKASKWGHSAVAITDHGVVQAFPDAYNAGKENGVKIIYGVEGYLINDCIPIVLNSNNKDFNQVFVVFDIETTGLNAATDEITEIGAVKICNGIIQDEFHSLVNPGIPIPDKITKLTGITNSMVENAPDISEVLSNFSAFCKEAVLVAHNASFDIGFIKEKGKAYGLAFHQPVIDTLALSRQLFKELKRHKLDTVAKYLNISLEKHHRAIHDARTTGEILLKCFDLLEEKQVYTLDEINTCFSRTQNLNGLESYHIVILAKDEEGLKNLYRIISFSHLNYFFRKPRIPKSLLAKYRQGLLIGTACEAGELFKAILNKNDDRDIDNIVKFYDYVEIQPIANNEYLVREGKVSSDDDLRKINAKIVSLGERFDKPVVATGDVHFLEPQDEYFRKILMNGQGFSDADYQPPLYLKTTDEMLEEFSYLGDVKSKKVVIDNPQKISDMTIEMKPFPDELYPPEIEGAEEEIKTMAMNKANAIYGNPLPDVVEKRLKKELDSIINNGFAVLYLIAHKLVKKSLIDGYLVGSRGSVGSSFVATMTDITEVNPLPPHYVCPQCKYSDFSIDIGEFATGMDLPDRACPRCGTNLSKDGYDISFEVFLGFKGDKVPDIDLNFSGDYQPVAHKYTEELFGEGHVFRAGTIGTIAEKTAYGFVKNYLDEKSIVATNAEINRLVKGCTGVKRTTGQHPGGVIVVPKKNDIHEFTPIQHPADDKTSGIITTHFDFNSLHDRLVKLDILGHDDPTVIRMLEDLTGINARQIPMGEKETMKLFSSTDPLGIHPEDINCPVGTFGIPEFGTRFVRQMLVDTKPTTMSELIRISGLSHGTDVWLNNAQDLIRGGIAQLSQVISTRDDIMIYLIYKGLEPIIAFKIMENVRKGKGLSEEYEEKMRENNITDWFIDSCKKIKYLFPKAHAAAYVMMAFRIAYFKVYYPEAFYTTYFTVRADDFDAGLILGGTRVVKNNIEAIEKLGNNATTKEKNILTILELALEMYQRKIFFIPIDLYQSDAVKFEVTPEGIRPPLNSLQGLGTSAAASIVEARKGGPFISIEDLQQRTKISKTVVEILKKYDCLNGLPETSQISLF